ncbi:trypsin-like peptidase domain-containing protein [Microbacteriaceae bacterium]|nr:trypsin-like peptidase domain-containing protein [Candidatus Saccharibacteria bacterium]
MSDAFHQEKKSKKQPIRKALILSGILLLLVGIVGIIYTKHGFVSTADRQTVKDDGNLRTTSNEEVIANIADTVSPSVVSIVTNVATQGIFGTVQEGQAAGTGIIISKDGYIITNKHVVKGASHVQVFLSNGTAYDNVTTVGLDPLNDIAYLKIEDVDNLTPAKIGDSSTVRVGQEVVAIGNSLGQYQNTVTSGVVSGKGRPVQAGDEMGSSTETLTDLLQTDAAINPGNSGGPLLNRSGQVIGINTAVAQNAQGIGFAIPINATKGATKSVLSGKGVLRSYLGVRYQDVTPALAKKYNLSTQRGAYIISSEGQSSIQKDGPADTAGLEEKDVIIKVNNLEVGMRGSVSSLIGEYSPGEKVVITVIRGNSTKDILVVLGKYTNV